jgi:hypothetical protein
MSYSRRQLYAMGEPLGDGATRREVGGKIIYGGGGGGDAPQPTTSITESGPTVENRTSSTKLPGYINANTQDIVSKARAIGDTPYQAYTGQRVADFTPDMLTAMERMRNQGVAGEIDQASGLAGLAGQRASDYGMFQEGVQQYMNPYMQNVVDVERRKAQEASDRQSAALSGQAAKMGAFGGSGAALQQRALTRDTAQQLSDIQSQGLNKAYESAANQYNTGITNMLSASGQLGGLGTTRFGQETDLIKNLGTSGDIQRQREQALLDVDYGNFAEKRDYAAKQLALQKALSSGLEYDTSTSSRSVSQPGKTVTQKVAAGGIVGGYADGGMVGHYEEGGITSLLSDQQIDQRQQMPNISDLARLSLQAKEMERARMRADQQNMDAQQAMMAQGPQDSQDPQNTVAADVMRQIAAARESGLAGLEMRPDLVTAAGGGIVAFADGDEVPAMTNEFGAPQAVPASSRFTPTDAYDNRFARGPAPDMSGTRGRQGIPELLTPPAPSPDKRSSMLDDIYNPMMGEIRAINAAERGALDAVEKDIKDEAKEGNSFTDKARERINARLKGLEGQDKVALESSILNFGFGLLAASGEKNKRKALGELGLNTLKGHASAMKDLQAKQERYEDAELELQKIEMGERRATKKEIRDLQLRKTQADTGMLKSMVEIMGDRGKAAVDLYKARLSASASGSRSPDHLALLTKYPAGTPEGDKLRENLEFIKGAGKPPPGAVDVVKSLTEDMQRVRMLLSVSQDPEKRALLQDQLNGIQAELLKAQGSKSSSGTNKPPVKWDSILTSASPV